MPFKVPLEAEVAASRPASGKNRNHQTALSRRRFLVLDEPTSVLTPQEADEVLGLLRGMAGAASSRF